MGTVPEKPECTVMLPVTKFYTIEMMVRPLYTKKKNFLGT